MRNIWISLISKFMMSLHWFAPVLLLYYQDIIGLSISDFFFVQAIFTLFVFVLEIPTGFIADRFSRKLSVVLGGLSGLVGLWFLHIAYSLNMVILAEFFLALNLALNSGAFESLYYESLVRANKLKQYPIYLGWLKNLHLGGLLVSVLSGSFLAVYFGLENIFLITFLTAIVPTIMYFFLDDVSVTSKGNLKANRGSEVSRNLQVFKDLWSVLHSKKEVLFLALDSAVIPAVAFMSIWLYQPFLIGYEVSILLFGFLHAGLVLAQMLVNYLVKHITWDLAKYLKYSQLSMFAGFLVLALVPNVIVSSLALMLIAGVGLTRSTYLNKEIQLHLEDSYRATFFSGVGMLNMLVRTALTFAIGYIIVWSQYFVAFVLALLILALYFLFQRQEQIITNLSKKKLL
ncbi:MFS transporter [bacterium]|jgi:MFS family permease|nr:MFS transporter [bacterium]